MAENYCENCKELKTENKELRDRVKELEVLIDIAKDTFDDISSLAEKILREF